MTVSYNDSDSFDEEEIRIILDALPGPVLSLVDLVVKIGENDFQKEINGVNNNLGFITGR